MIARTALMALAALAIGGVAAKADTGLQPYQLVRSLQLMQDRIANGDHAALPMQRKALEMVDARMRSGTAQDFSDARNLRALFVYGISGGNPQTIASVVSRLTLDGENAQLGAGILAYLRGDTKAALDALGPIDARLAPADLGAFVSLLKGSVNAPTNPIASFRFFDEARLLGPGTLVEEAALRRSIMLASQVGDAPRFVSASSQFVRRFLRSPYAGQFADSFVDGIFSVEPSLDLQAASGIVAMMSAEQSRTIFLRIARRAAIDGNARLAAFAADGLSGKLEADAETADARALLYEGLAAIASDKAKEAHDQLAGLDRNMLSRDDLRLLDAALTVSGEVVARPAGLRADDGETADDTVAAPAVDHGAARDISPLVPATPPASVSLAVQPATTEQLSQPPSELAPPPIVSRARERLAEIDKLLERKRRQ